MSRSGHPGYPVIARLGLLIILCTASALVSAQSGLHQWVTPVSGHAYDPVYDKRLTQREQFKEALKLVRLRKKAGYEKIRQELRDYPLFPYLEFEEISSNLTTADPQVIAAFVQRYRNTPLSSELMRDWLEKLGQKQLWHRFSKYYDENYQTDTLACYRGMAQYRLGKRDAAFDAARSLWLVDHSQEDACDSLFDAWKKAGQLKPEVALQRYVISLNGRNTRLANYLTRYLSNEGRSDAAFFRKVYGNPSLIGQYHRFNDPGQDIDRFISRTLAKLARSDAKSALTHFEYYSRTRSFTQSKADELQLVLAINLALQTGQVDALGSLPASLVEHPELIEALIRDRLKEKDWVAVQHYIGKFPEITQQHPRWRYWLARALLQTGDVQDQVSAAGTLTKLAEVRNFYGFLAADLLQQPYEFQHTPTLVDEESLYSMEQMPGIERSLELFAIEEWRDARREWRYATQNFSRSEYQVAAEIARRWQWHKQAIQSMIEAQAWNDLGTRFPMAYQEAFHQASDKAAIPVQWSMAIARQESAFMPDAVSSAGALGVMQLLPSTAKYTARKSGLRYRSKRDLLEPEYNIKLGTAYLGMMLERFNNNRVLASVAYNAGPERAKKWRDQSIPFDLWVENIPFAETRQYVQNVLVFSAIYSRHMNHSPPLVHPQELQDFAQLDIDLSVIQNAAQEKLMAQQLLTDTSEPGHP